MTPRDQELALRRNLDRAEEALRENLHMHCLDETARAHMERALNHTREARVAAHEIGQARSVQQLAATLDKVEALMERVRHQQPQGPILHHVRD